MWGCSFGFKLDCDLGVLFPCTNGIYGTDSFKLIWNQIRSGLVPLMWCCAWTKEQWQGLPPHHSFRILWSLFATLAGECNPWGWGMSLPSCIWMSNCVISSAKKQGVSPLLSLEMISDSSALKCSVQTLTNFKSGLNSSRLLVDQKRTSNCINCFQLIDCFLNNVTSLQVLDVFPLMYLSSLIQTYRLKTS